MTYFRVVLLSCLMIYSMRARAEPVDVCVAAFEEAQQEQAPIAAHRAGRGVTGQGRLHFHTAPDQRCQLKNLFVIPGDRLEAFADYGVFTNVIFWNGKTGAGTAGWVLSSRLADTTTVLASIPAAR
jgi:hypothetical protein